MTKKNPKTQTSLSDSFLKQTLDNQAKLKKGIPTIIPFFSDALAKRVPGLELGSMAMITAGTGEGKSRTTRKMFIKDPIAFANSTGMKVRIILNSLEESKEKVISTFIGSYIKNKFNKTPSYYELNNLSKSTPMGDARMKTVIHAAEWVNKIYGPFLRIVHEPNSFGFYKIVVSELMDLGTFYKVDEKEGTKVIVSNPLADFNSWNKFEYTEPTLVIAISDTINQYQPYGGKSKYDCLFNFSSFFSRQKLGLQCGVISVLVAQQTPDKSKISTDYRGNIEIDKLKPSIDGLNTCRATSEHCTFILGIFDPTKFQKDNFDYMGYKKLHLMKRGKYRNFIILKTREGEIAYPFNNLHVSCDFAVDEIEDLPPPGDPDLEKFFK